MHRPLPSFPVSVLLLVAFPAIAAAQDRRWEVEGYVGVLAAQPESAGTRTLPPAGAPIATSTPTFPARATSSWFFGDGASVLNGVLQEFGLASRISPLDGMFAPVAARRTSAFGLRVRRWITPRSALEISVEGPGGRSIDTANLEAGVDTATSGFIAAFHDLFAAGPFSSATVATEQAAVDGPYNETAVTASFNHDIGHHALRPYFTAGGGAVFPTHFLFSAQLKGRYTTAILGEVPIDETDLVSINVVRSTTFAIVAGGGLRCDLSLKWALRFDARWLVGPDSTRMTISAQPSSVRGTPAGFIESFTNPAIQFSNDPATGRASSLSGTPLKDVEVFNGGVIARTVIGIAIARRF